MMYLLDTNVISEPTRKAPSEPVLRWLNSMDPSKFSLSVITLGEIRKGVELLDNPHKKQAIISWLEGDLLNRFHGRILAVDEAVSDKWGYILSRASVPAVDALIAASALVHNHTLVTRNTKDFKMITGLEVLNPWDGD